MRIAVLVLALASFAFAKPGKETTKLHKISPFVLRSVRLVPPSWENVEKLIPIKYMRMNQISRIIAVYDQPGYWRPLGLKYGSIEEFRRYWVIAEDYDRNICRIYFETDKEHGPQTFDLLCSPFLLVPKGQGQEQDKDKKKNQEPKGKKQDKKEKQHAVQPVKNNPSTAEAE